MKKFITYYLFYSIGGFVLERIINLIAYQEWYDNSVMIGPYQGLYGLPVVLTIYVFEYIKKTSKSKSLNEILFIVTAILFTGLSEYLTGTIYKYLTGITLWNYTLYFPYSHTFIGWIPTTIFGLGSYLIIKYLHPKIKVFLDSFTPSFIYLVFIIYMLDWFYTLYRLLLERVV